MISKIPGYKTSDGQWFAEIDQAQVHELAVLLKPVSKEQDDYYHEACSKLVGIKEQAIAVLGMKQRGRPRLVAVPKKPRKAKACEGTCACVEEEEKPHVKACKV